MANNILGFIEQRLQKDLAGGASPEELEARLNEGLEGFKKGFKGKLVKFIGAYDFPYSPLFYNLFEHGSAWWKNLNSLIRKGKIEDSLSE